MSQQGFTIVSLVEADLDVGDLEYIEGKVLAGDYFQVSGDINAIEDTIEQIVPNGKTAFLIEAKIVPTGHATNNKVEAELKIDGDTKDTVNFILAQANEGGASPDWAWGNGLYSGNFNVLGISLVGDGVKVIEIENTLDGGTAFATMSGYFVDT